MTHKHIDLPLLKIKVNSPVPSTPTDSNKSFKNDVSEGEIFIKLRKMNKKVHSMMNSKTQKNYCITTPILLLTTEKSFNFSSMLKHYGCKYMDHQM